MLFVRLIFMCLLLFQMKGDIPTCNITTPLSLRPSQLTHSFCNPKESQVLNYNYNPKLLCSLRSGAYAVEEVCLAPASSPLPYNCCLSESGNGR